MFCPKCGITIEEGEAVCPNCGLDTAIVNQNPNSVVTHSVTNSVTLNAKLINKNIRFIYFGLAAVVLIMFFIAASNIVAGGNEIMQIRSVGGKTLEEAYYNELGSIYVGYAMISRALGIFFASVLVWLGLKNSSNV